MRFEPERVVAFAATAETEELLDRVTIYHDEMEPEAVDIFLAELFRRGATAEQVVSHGEARDASAVRRPDGSVVRCDDCFRPAVVVERRWHRVYGLLPVFPRWRGFCGEHRRTVSRIGT